MSKITELSLKVKSLQRRVRNLSGGGVWRTIRGRHVLVGEGEMPLEALKKSIGGKSGSPSTLISGHHVALKKNGWKHDPSQGGSSVSVYEKKGVPGVIVVHKNGVWTHSIKGGAWSRKVKGSGGGTVQSLQDYLNKK